MDSPSLATLSPGLVLALRVGRTRRALLLASGVVPAVSWHVPLLLGSNPQLNFVVPAWAILAAYGALLACGIAVIQGVAHVLPRRDAGWTTLPRSALRAAPAAPTPCRPARRADPRPGRGA